MKTFSYCPPALYRFLLDMAEDNKLSVKEIQIMFMRKIAQDYGFDCPHEEIGYSPKTKEPFCKRCWTRLTVKREMTYFKGKLIKSAEYEPVETFLDRFYSERKSREEIRVSKFEHEI